MSPNRCLRRKFPALLLLVILFASLPADAAPVRREVAALGKGVIAWVHELFRNLWMRGATKEGMSIDPDGQQKEGMWIDPDGSH